jgi:hypothetical protein
VADGPEQDAEGFLTPEGIVDGLRRPRAGVGLEETALQVRELLAEAMLFEPAILLSARRLRLPEPGGISVRRVTTCSM